MNSQKLRSSKAWMIGGWLCLLPAVAAALWSATLDPTMVQERHVPFQPPTGSHLLGTDDLGYDIFLQLCVSAEISLSVGILAGGLSVVLGTAIGMMAGFFGNVSREWLTGWIDAVLLIPMVPFLMLLSVYLGQHTETMIFAFVLVGWCGTARAVRAKVLQLRTTSWIEALKGLGLSQSRILLRHVLPNVWDVVSAKFITSCASAMIAEASLSFLGLGDPIRSSWGKMVHDAFQRGGFANGMVYWYVPPGLCIAFCTFGLMLIGIHIENRATIETDVSPE